VSRLKLMISRAEGHTDDNILATFTDGTLLECSLFHILLEKMEEKICCMEIFL